MPHKAIMYDETSPYFTLHVLVAKLGFLTKGLNRPANQGVTLWGTYVWIHVRLCFN